MTGFFYRQLAKASGNGAVAPGELVRLKVDLALAHDGSGPEILRIFSNQRRTVAPGSRVLVTLDHCFPASTIADREFQQQMQVFARQNNIILFKNGEGVLHQVVAEEESLWPGMVIVGADGHVATAGAFGAIAFPISPQEFVETVSRGEYQIRVPEQVVVGLDGIPKPQVMTRDIALFLKSRFGQELQGKALLLTGSAIESMNISEKMSLCNFMPECKVATALVLPMGEQVALDFRVDVRQIMPMLARPGNEGKICPASSCAGTSISVAIAGGCSSGRLDDMQTIGEILAKGEVHDDVTFIITPGSRSVLDSMEKMGISGMLRSSGAVIMPPGCGPCPGRHLGLLSDTDGAVTTTIRNSPGRIGAEGAAIYLASPRTVALSAVHG
ncbi:MAG: aconitase family protein, partial [Desulfofustis sp.]